jgi:hypothetical protein
MGLSKHGGDSKNLQNSYFYCGHDDRMRLGDGFKVCTFKQAQIGDAQRNQRPCVVQSDLGSATARPLNENQLRIKDRILPEWWSSVSCQLNVWDGNRVLDTSKKRVQYRKCRNIFWMVLHFQLSPGHPGATCSYTHIRSFSKLGHSNSLALLIQKPANSSHNGELKFTRLPKQLAWIRHKKAKWNLAEIPSSICNSGYPLVNTQKAT